MRPETALNLGWSAPLSRSKILDSAVDTTAPLSVILFIAIALSYCLELDSASQTRWTSWPDWSKSIVVCWTQTWDSIPHMMICFFPKPSRWLVTSGVIIENCFFSKTGVAGRKSELISEQVWPRPFGACSVAIQGISKRVLTLYKKAVLSMTVW